MSPCTFRTRATQRSSWGWCLPALWFTRTGFGSTISHGECVTHQHVLHQRAGTTACEVRWDRPCSTASCQLKPLCCLSRNPCNSPVCFHCQNKKISKIIMKNGFCRLKAQSSLIILASLAVFLAPACGCKTGFSLILLISFCPICCHHHPNCFQESLFLWENEILNTTNPFCHLNCPYHFLIYQWFRLHTLLLHHGRQNIN